MIISCLILNYNDSETTLSLLKRIEEYQILNYIIIVDNNSSDDSYKKLSEHVSDKMILLKTDKNGGYGYGNNYGIRYAYYTLHSDFLLIVNPDVIFHEELVNALVNALKSHKDCAIATAQGVNVNGKYFYPKKYTNGINDVLSTSLIFNKLIKAKYYRPDQFTNNEYCFVFEVPGCLLLVDTELMIKYGMYDEDIFLFEEEKTLGFKMLQNGYKSIFLPRERYIHIHSTSISKAYRSNVKKRKLLLDSRIIFLKKYRKYNNLQIILVKFFFILPIIEMSIYSIFLELKNKILHK